MSVLLFHTGWAEIPAPDLRHGRKNADFGQGFYLSGCDAFAGKWARERRGEAVIVNRYELDTEGLRILRLARDEAWYQYIFANRAGRADLHPEADVIVGPIANDTIYDTLGIFTSGFLAPEEALRLLRIGPEYEQIVLKTEKAAAHLRFLGARTGRSPALPASSSASRRRTRRLSPGPWRPSPEESGMKTLYVSDLNGTLLRSDERTSPYTNRVVNALTERSVLFSYATARSLVTAKKATRGIVARMPLKGGTQSAPTSGRPFRSESGGDGPA